MFFFLFFPLFSGCFFFLTLLCVSVVKLSHTSSATVNQKMVFDPSKAWSLRPARQTALRTEHTEQPAGAGISLSPPALSVQTSQGRERYSGHAWAWAARFLLWKVGGKGRAAMNNSLRKGARKLLQTFPVWVPEALQIFMLTAQLSVWVFVVWRIEIQMW